MPRVILDENILRGVKEWLMKKGFDLTTVASENLKGVNDYSLVEYAVSNKFTVLTLDNHFAQIYRIRKQQEMTVIIIKANLQPA